MRRALFLLALATLLVFARPVLSTNTAEEWDEDLDAFLAVLTEEHENPYFTTPKTTFDADVKNYRTALPTLTRSERITGLARVVALVGDGHTWLPMHQLPFEGLPPGPGFRPLPVRFELFEDGLYVVGATPEYRSLLGKRVEQFDGVSSDEAIDRALRLLPQDAVNFSAELVPEWLMQLELLQALGLAPEGDQAVVVSSGVKHLITALPTDRLYDWVFSMDGGPQNEDWLTASERIPLWRMPLDKPWRYENLGDVVYFRFREIRDGTDLSLSSAAETAVATAESLNKPGLIIDLRNCMGGNGQLNAGFIDILKSSTVLEGRIAVLISRQTHSAAIMLVSDLERLEHPRFYGQATADRPNHYGETNLFVTPNSALPIIYASEYYQTSLANDDRRFREPDVFIPYLFSDYRIGRDPVLDRARLDIKEKSQ